MKTKVTKVFSGPLFRQSLRSNIVLTVLVLVIMIMMSIVISYASHLMTMLDEDEDITEAETEFYSYLYVLASYNDMAGTSLSYDDFVQSDDLTTYETVFDMMAQQADMDLTVEGFESSAAVLADTDSGIDFYITQFEYVYALNGIQGCFSGDDLDIESMMANMLEMMGMSSDMMDAMEDMDASALINQMYFTIMLILPVLLFIIVVGNALVVDQVDKGSMAYILSTPTKRSAVAVTQLIYMIVVPLVLVAVTCGVRMAAMNAFVGEVDVAQTLALYGALYLLVEAMASICYFSSCFFNMSRYSMGLGGGLNIWFFLASLLGMFGSETMVEAGIGVEALDNFNRLTLIGLFDIDSLSTVGSGAVDTAFVPKLCILAAIAVAFYIVGAVRFSKKDLPL